MMLLNPYRFGTPATDPYYANVSFLLHFGGADESTTFTDEKGKTFTASGNAKIDTAESRFGGTAGKITSSTASSANYVSSASHADFQMGGGDFTMEISVRWPTVYTTNFSPVFMAKRAASNNEFSWAWFNGDLYFTYSTDGTATPFVSVAWTPSANTWYDLIVTRSGGDLKFGVNGVQQGATQSISGTIFSGTAALSLFTDRINDSRFDGWIDEARMTKGVARTITPLIAPFPNS